jgi:hypothetical protein
MLSPLMSNTNNPAQWTGEIQTPGHYCWSTAYLLQSKNQFLLGQNEELRWVEDAGSHIKVGGRMDLHWGNSWMWTTANHCRLSGD